MPIAIDGQKFEDEFDYAMSQLDTMHNETYEPANGLPSAGTATYDDPKLPWPEYRQKPPVRLDPVWDGKYDDSPTGAAMTRERAEGFDPKDLGNTLRWQEPGGGTGANAYNQPLADLKLGQEMDIYVTKRGAQEVSDVKRPIIGPEEDLSKVPRITVTPKPPAEDQSSKSEDDASKAQEAPLSYGGEKLRTAFRRLTGTGGEERLETWPEKAARGLISGFMLPGDVASGTVDPDSAEARGRAFELASGMIFGPAPVANKIVDGTLGSFAGVKALTANRPNLDLATQMAKKGMDRDQIYEATGWWKGLEGKWRHEIPDGKAKFTDAMVDASHRSLANPENIQRGTLSDVLNHPALFKAYPFLKDIEFQIDNKLNALGSHLTAPNGKETISLNLEKIIKDERYHPLEVVLHEIQHSIQKEEGFNPGSSPARALQKALEFIRDRKDSLARGDREVPGDKFTEWDRLRQLENAIAKNPKTQFGDRLGDVIYRRTPGEIEPRAIELRSAVERKYGEGSLKEPPYHTVEGVADPLAFPGEIAPGASLSLPPDQLKIRLNQILYDRSLAKKRGDYNEQDYAQIDAQIRLLRQKLKDRDKEK